MYGRDGAGQALWLVNSAVYSRLGQPCSNPQEPVTFHWPQQDGSCCYETYWRSLEGKRKSCLVLGYLSKESVKAGTLQTMFPNFRTSIVFRNVPSILPFVLWYEPRWACNIGGKKKHSEKSLPTATSCTTNVIWNLCGERLQPTTWAMTWPNLILTRIIQSFSPYRAVNTFRFGYKSQPVNAVQWNNSCLFSQNTKHINTKCGQNVECRTYRAVNTLRLSYKNQPTSQYCTVK